jgi:putative transposase
LRRYDSGVSADEICREMGISQAAFYKWKKKYAGIGVSELRQLKNLEDENRRLKKLVADLSLDKHILQEVLAKKF